MYGMRLWNRLIDDMKTRLIVISEKEFVGSPTIHQIEETDLVNILSKWDLESEMSRFCL
jgi:hypothetical protein